MLALRYLMLKNEINIKKVKKHKTKADKLDIQKDAKSENRICRVCLKHGDIPIFGGLKDENISEPLQTFTNIQIEASDNFPKYICNDCHSLLHSAILLRKTAETSDQTLRDTLEEIQYSDGSIEDNFCTKNLIDKPIELTYKFCHICELSFSLIENYNSHLLSAEHKLKAMKYSDISKKNNKERQKSEDEQTFMCDICGKRFKYKQSFTQHRSTHFYDLPFKCSLCPYKGRLSDGLRMHMRTHTGEKPYKCKQCPKSFVNKSNLNRHTLTHKSDYDFKCETCSRGFYTKRELETHTKIDHTGIKEHFCDTCGKPFGHRKQMMKHQLKVHKRKKLRGGRMPAYLKVESELHEMQLSTSAQYSIRSELKDLTSYVNL